MIDREKVNKGLECCIKSTWNDPFAECEHCPYNEISIFVQECRAVLSADALALLKEQEVQKFFVDESGKITPLPVVVRCKDCKHYRYYGLSEETVSECRIDHCENPDADWFCADGERESTQTNAKNNALDVR